MASYGSYRAIWQPSFVISGFLSLAFLLVEIASGILTRSWLGGGEPCERFASRRCARLPAPQLETGNRAKPSTTGTDISFAPLVMRSSTATRRKWNRRHFRAPPEWADMAHLHKSKRRSSLRPAASAFSGNAGTRKRTSMRCSAWFRSWPLRIGGK